MSRSRETIALIITHAWNSFTIVWGSNLLYPLKGHVWFEHCTVNSTV